MRGLKALLFLFFLFSILYGLLLLITPAIVADFELGPQEVPAARYTSAIFLGLSAAVWYAFRNPQKNVAVIRSLIMINALSVVIGVYDGITGDESWGPALMTIVFSAFFAGGLAIFYPRDWQAI